MSSRLLLFFYLFTRVVCFQTVRAPFASRYLSQCRDSCQGSSSCTAASKSNDSQENVVDQWVATGKTVVSTFLLGWTLAASVAMANTDVLSAVTVVDELIQASPEQTVVVNSGTSDLMCNDCYRIILIFNI
jgi:hypothetical protein